MSAVRRGSRASHRAATSSPYARSNPPIRAKSTWSLSSLLRYLNPFPHAQPASDFDEDLEQDVLQHTERPESLKDKETPRNSLLKEAGQPVQPPASTSIFNTPPAPPLSSSPTNPFLAESPSRADNLKNAVNFLNENRGKTLTGDQVDNLATFLQRNMPVEEEKRVPFRFSTTPTGSPRRGNSPLSPLSPTFHFGSGRQSGSDSVPPNSSSRKTLSKNPNGVYRWEGGGSAKPIKSRNRYHSPAFGSPRSTPDRISMRDTEGSEKKEEVTTKRRRVDSSGPDADEAPIRSAAPAPSPTRAAQAQTLPFPTAAGSPSPTKINGQVAPTLNGSSSKPKVNGSPTKPLTISVSASRMHPSTPSNPSPLRQAWGQGSPPSGSESSPPSKQPTKAASFMVNLIKESTPPKKPDVSNPYQAASPVKITNNVTKTRGKRVRATGRPAQKKNQEVLEDKDKMAVDEEKKTEKEYSAQAIIEATVPKGSKRSRPPTNFEEPAPAVRSPSPPAPRRSPRRETPPPKQSSPETDETTDEADGRASKRSKPNGVNGTHTEPAPEKPASKAVSPSPPARTLSSSGLKSAAKEPSKFVPKEPSKLRFSYQPVTSPSPPIVEPMGPPPPVTKLGESSKKTLDPREAALSTPVTSLPKFEFDIPTVTVFSVSVDMKSVEQAKSMLASSLPKFNFDTPAEKIVSPAASTPVAPAPSKPATQSFNWEAAGMKAPTVAPGTWKCSACDMMNDVAEAQQCSICDEPRSKASVPAPVVVAPTPSPVKAFDWTAAGMKKPDTNNWSCSTCMVMNKPELRSCISCGEDR
ncbi:hypothetical protein C8J56DRAFT_1061648 [Mycena floridula]|nr:hypothetical protein C8J56DRAFT_1061648 [Mycena floridula]